ILYRADRNKDVWSNYKRDLLITRIEMTSINVISIRKYPNLFIPLSNSVSGTLCFNLLDILPNSVLVPVFITNALANPLITKVPINIQFILFLRGVSFDIIPSDLSTG